MNSRNLADEQAHATRFRRITVGALCDALDGLPSDWTLVASPVTGNLIAFDSADLPHGYIDVPQARYVEFD